METISCQEGETASVVLLDSILRLLPGVLGGESSLQEESFNGHLLEYPQYTKPQRMGGSKSSRRSIIGKPCGNKALAFRTVQGYNTAPKARFMAKV